MEGAKTLILSNVNKKGQAILNLRSDKDSEIKFFNFEEIKNKNFALGIKQGERVIKVPLNIKNNLCKFRLSNEIDIKSNVLCAIVDVTNAFCPEILLSGSNNTKSENDVIEEKFVATKPEDTAVLYEEDSLEDINKIVDKNLEEDMNSTYFDNCSHCKYREAFYNDCGGCSLTENNRVENESVEEKIDANIDGKKEEIKETKNEEESTFYEQIKAQIDALFKKYESEDNLSTIVANSKWVKINYDNGENYYVLGLIYDDKFEKVEFISYGIPAKSKDNPPEDLKDFAQWLPVENLSQEFSGYFLVYQKAFDGETVKVDYV